MLYIQYHYELSTVLDRQEKTTSSDSSHTQISFHTSIHFSANNGKDALVAIFAILAIDLLINGIAYAGTYAGSMDFHSLPELASYGDFVISFTVP